MGGAVALIAKGPERVYSHYSIISASRTTNTSRAIEALSIAIEALIRLREAEGRAL